MSPAPDTAPIVCTTHGVAETKALAASVADLVDLGDLILLVGDLGAGKTAFTQGLAGALDVVAPVTSPTFTLANRYEGRLVVNHLDVYRFDDLAEVEDLALPELLEEGVTLIEWGDTILPALPPDRLEIRVTFGAGDDDRCFEITAVGEAWAQRRDELSARLGEWGGS